MIRPSLERFQTSILAKVEPDDEALLIAREGPYEVFYAPFEHVNFEGKIVIVGITPGRFQAAEAISAACSELASGASTEDALASAKVAASFSGGMRTNLVNMLDHFSVNELLGIRSCQSLWSEDSHLAHFTSALRYPVFCKGKNYTGRPSMLNSQMLKTMLETWTGEELRLLNDALIVPLGDAASEALSHLVNERILDASRVVFGFQHPSGANNERVSYFIGRKDKAALSTKVNADKIDTDRGRVLRVLEQYRN